MSPASRGFDGELLAVGVGEDALEGVLDVDAVVDVVQETDEIGVPSDDAVEEGEEALDEGKIVLAELVVEVEERGVALDALLVRLGGLEVAEVEEDVRVLGLLLGTNEGDAVAQAEELGDERLRADRPVRLCSAVAFSSSIAPTAPEGGGGGSRADAAGSLADVLGGRARSSSASPARIPRRLFGRPRQCARPGCCCLLPRIGRGRGVIFRPSSPPVAEFRLVVRRTRSGPMAVKGDLRSARAAAAPRR